MNWLKGFFGNIYAFWTGMGTPLYEQGYFEGYEDGREDGHEHGACKHTHPFEEAHRNRQLQGSAWGSYHGE